MYYLQTSWFTYCTCSLLGPLDIEILLMNNKLDFTVQKRSNKNVVNLNTGSQDQIF